MTEPCLGLIYKCMCRNSWLHCLNTTLQTLAPNYSTSARWQCPSPGFWLNFYTVGGSGDASSVSSHSPYKTCSGVKGELQSRWWFYSMRITPTEAWGTLKDSHHLTAVVPFCSLAHSHARLNITLLSLWTQAQFELKEKESWFDHRLLTPWPGVARHQQPLWLFYEKGHTDGNSGSTFIYFTIFWIIVSRKLCKGKLCLLSFIFLAISFLALDNICLLLRPWRSFRPSQHRRLNVIWSGSLLFSTILSSVPHFYMRVTFHCSALSQYLETFSPSVSFNINFITGPPRLTRHLWLFKQQGCMLPGRGWEWPDRFCRFSSYSPTCLPSQTLHCAAADTTKPWFTQSQPPRWVQHNMIFGVQSV